MSYEQMAIKAYRNDTEEKRHKAIAAGKAIDNACELEHATESGVTRCHFMLSNWLKYFSSEALGDRVKLLYNQTNQQ